MIGIIDEPLAYNLVSTISGGDRDARFGSGFSYGNRLDGSEQRVQASVGISVWDTGFFVRKLFDLVYGEGI